MLINAMRPLFFRVTMIREPDGPICQEIKENFKEQLDFMLANPAIESFFAFGYVFQSKKGPRKLVAEPLETGSTKSTYPLWAQNPFPEHTVPFGYVHVHPAADTYNSVPSRTDVEYAKNVGARYVCVVQPKTKKMVCVDTATVIPIQLPKALNVRADVYFNPDKWERYEQERLEELPHCVVDL
ncbi:Uncharacterised protein [uncultured archaeon]|nr:Uncharacterised protein [uncultured archaeon]